MTMETMDSDTGRYFAPFRQLCKARLVEFLREPEAIFWVYGFPLLMTVILGAAFREKRVEQIIVDVQSSPEATAIVEMLKSAEKEDKEFIVATMDEANCRKRMRAGKSALVVIPGDSANSPIKYMFDPTRPDSVLAWKAVNERLQNAFGRKDVRATSTQEFSEPGGRYIDFLVPGLLGMGLMGGGLWGVGFVTVDMRIRKLLKRFLATPMKKSEFLLAIMTSRFLFMVPEVLIILLSSYLIFGVRVHGNWVELLATIMLGAFMFSGIGLLVASRANTIETVSGLMNLIMVPMWICSGVFFSSERFPDWIQFAIQALPLTMLNNILRALINDGQSLVAHPWMLVGMLLWGIIPFLLALKLFRWQ